VTPGGKLTWAARREAKRNLVLPPDPVFDDEEGRDYPADETMIGRAFTPECKQIVYEYDFGDSWEHLVRLEKRSPGGDPAHVPQCLAGENAAPLDDMGGMYGYYDWLDALRDPAHEMHEEAVDWLGEGFDPARFDLDEPNRRLAEAFKPVTRRPRKRRKKGD
jgi:hypothetical protein